MSKKNVQDGRKVLNNLCSGIASQLLTIILGIIVPYLTLNSYGSEVNGLISSVTQIYAYLALLEAGIGLATLQALYKTLGSKDIPATNAVLSATNHYYHRTGYVYLGVIIIFSFVYPLLVSSDIPFWTVVLVIFLNGIGNVINFFFQGKYVILLQAEGKTYIHTRLNMITNVIKNVAKILLMYFNMDVVFVQAIGLVISLIQMTFITWYIKTRYKWLDLSVKPDRAAISQSRNVLVHQFTGLIFNNTDTILLTAFCGLKVVSVYSMYLMLFSMISTAQNTISGSATFVMGQAFNTDRKKFEKLYDCYELYYVAIVFALYSITNFFILPFMGLYTAGATDIEYVDKYLPPLFVTIHLMSCGRNAPSYVIQFSKKFKETQWRAVLEAVINIVVSLVGVYFLGIYGVLLGTIAALLYRTNDIIIYANKRILKQGVWKTYRRWLVDLAVYVLILGVNELLYPLIDLSGYLQIFLWLIPYSIFVFALYFVVVSLIDRKTARAAIEILRSKLGGRFAKPKA